MADRVGQHLGNYRLVRLLGRGGFAEVYLGEHLRLGAQAAIKVLHTSLEDEDDMEGFLREAKTVARLKHPHIVRVFDFDVENHTPFLVMDYLSNGNIRRSHPKGTPLPQKTIVSYVTQVASALQYAHDEKLIHRDIKPENMLLDQDNTLVLSDFGIALMSQSSRYQSTQEVAGTAAYMAPEQFQGHPRRASDQYALGVIVYEWLTGDRPFHGSFSEIASQHLFIPPLSLRGKVSTVSPDVEQVVQTALTKDPEQRFGSVKAFATALEQAYQNTQASPELPRVPLPSSASVTEPGEQTFPTELPSAELAPSPEQPAFQTPLQSSLSVPLPPETPSGSPAILSSLSLPPTTPAQSLPLPDEPRTRWHTEREAPEKLGKEPFPTLAPGSSRIGGLVVPPREKLIQAISIVVASALLAAVLGNWIVSRELVRTPRSTLTATAPRSTPTSTPYPKLGTVLYQADWSRGLNGWVGTSDWKVLNGMLQDDGSYYPSATAGPTIVAPFLPETADYAVEARIQKVGGACFDPVTFRGSQGTDGWHGYKITVCGGNIGFYRDDLNGMIAITPFDPGNSWHLYRVEAKGPQIKVFIDGRLVLEGNDNTYLSAGQVGIKSSAQLIVSSFKIIAL